MNALEQARRLLTQIAAAPEGARWPAVAAWLRANPAPVPDVHIAVSPEAVDAALCASGLCDHACGCMNST